MPNPAPTAIADHTVRQVKTFLFNLAVRTRQHAQIDSVTRQVTHQYRGRTAIELLQNAHDALRRGADGGAGRVAFCLADEGDHGALYVANDGRPVQEREAAALAEIGLSSKDPATDVGNKGLGFRSVLDVTDRPAVYSCSAERGGVLDGHGLRFTPAVLDDVARATAHALAGRPAAFLGADDLLADWSDAQREALRQRGREEGDGWPASELRDLSPYALPVPAAPTPSAERLAADGYSTVVHLPLRSADARTNVQRELEELHQSDDLGLFLDALRVLSVDVGGDDSRWELRRSEPRPPQGPLRHRTVTLTRSRPGARSSRSFSVWSRTVGDAPEETAALRAAAAQLPDDWSSVVRATVDVATEHAEAPPTGRYSISLPTVQPTGTGAFVNAPFYGDLDRRGVDFDHPYNDLLRREAIRLSAYIALDLVSDDGGDPRAVTDLVAPVGDPAASLAPAVHAVIEDQAASPIARVPLIRTPGGWAAPYDVRVADLHAERCPLDAAALADLAGFAQPDGSLATRSTRVRDLLAACGLSPAPSTDERADLAEAVAAAVPPDGDWDGFWEWARELCGNTVAPLRTRRVLLVGGDRRLALDGDRRRCSFPPQVGAAADGPRPRSARRPRRLPRHPPPPAGHPERPEHAGAEGPRGVRVRPQLRRPGDRPPRPPPGAPPAPGPPRLAGGRPICTSVLRWAVRLYAERAVGSDLNDLPVPCQWRLAPGRHHDVRARLGRPRGRPGGLPHRGRHAVRPPCPRPPRRAPGPSPSGKTTTPTVAIRSATSASRTGSGSSRPTSLSVFASRTELPE